MPQGYEHASPVRDPNREVSPMEHALLNQAMFTRDQVAWLMSQATRWGREAGEETGYRAGRVDGYRLCEQEWNEAARTQVADFNAADVSKGLARKWLRKQSDTMLRNPRPGDYHGGPVAWDDEPIPIERGRPELRVAA